MRSSGSSAVLRNSAASGISTISDSQSTVRPMVRPKPGMTLRCARKVRCGGRPLGERP